jgi:hypothetical protein
MPTVPTVASKVFRQVRASITMDGMYTLLRWLLDLASITVAIEHGPKGRCFGVLHKDGVPENDEFIIIDIRVMGQTVLLGWVQLL